MTRDDVFPSRPFETPAIVYKPIDTHGGLEQYVAELALTLDAPIYCASQSIEIETPRGRPDVIEFGTERIGWVGERLPMGTVGEILAYENFEVPDHHDVVISVSEPAKAVIHHPHQRRYHLLNMPPRWLYDQAPGRFEADSLVGTAKRLYQSALRVHDTSTVSRIDDFVVPSEVIGRRLRTYYSREATAIIYPPVDVDQYRYESRDGFLLYVGRLSPNKRVAELVAAISETDRPLKVAGTGPEAERVRRLAGDNVELLGYVSESKKRDLLARCDGLVFNSDREAFGIVPIEAFASGKPVVGIKEGFTSIQVQPQVNGVPFERGRASLQEAIEQMYETKWDPERIQETAERYGVERFHDEWRRLLMTRD